MTPTPAVMVDELLAAGATLGHVARILGVSTSAVCRWRSGERQPSEFAHGRLLRLYTAVVAAPVPVGTVMEGEAGSVPAGDAA